MMTADAFAAWVDAAAPGESVVSHVGLLMLARAEGRAPPGLAWLAMRCAAAGLVSLVQRRLESGQCQYIAQRRRPPQKRRK